MIFNQFQSLKPGAETDSQMYDVFIKTNRMNESLNEPIFFQLDARRRQRLM